MRIDNIILRKIYDSRQEETLEAEMKNGDFAVVSSIPHGKSRGIPASGNPDTSIPTADTAGQHTGTRSQERPLSGDRSGGKNPCRWPGRRWKVSDIRDRCSHFSFYSQRTASQACSCRA